MQLGDEKAQKGKSREEYAHQADGARGNGGQRYTLFINKVNVFVINYYADRVAKWTDSPLERRRNAPLFMNNS
jgi:hypothetical protein